MNRKRNSYTRKVPYFMRIIPYTVADRLTIIAIAITALLALWK